MAVAAPSYAHGTAAHPAARRDDRRQPRARRSPRTATARRSSSATRASAGPTPSSTPQVDRVARGADRRRARAGRPGRHLVAELRRVGARRSTRRRRPARSSSTSTRPTARPSSSTCSTSPAAGCSSRRARSRPRTTPRWSSEVRAVVRRARAGRVPRLARLGRAARAPATVAPDALRERAAALQFDDPINIQYTSGTTGFPKGATLSHHNILNNGFFVAEACGYTEEDRVCIPVPFYHCFGMVMGNLGCTTHGACMVIPAPAFEPRRDARRGRRRSAARRSTACRRCSSPSSTTRTSTTSTCRACAPGSWPARRARSRSCARCIDRMHMREVTICYGMTETSPVSTQTGADDDVERRTGTVGRVHPARRGQDRRPGDRRVRPARRARRAVHARLLRDARLLGRAREDRRGDRPRRLDAHRRPRDDGRRRLREHRRPHQGHDHPRRRERLPARDRGVPLHASRTSPTCRSSACPTSATARRSPRA